MGWDPERRRADLRRGYGAGSGEEEGGSPERLWSGSGEEKAHSAVRGARGRGALHRAPRREAPVGVVRPSACVSGAPAGEWRRPIGE